MAGDEFFQFQEGNVSTFSKLAIDNSLVKTEQKLAAFNQQLVNTSLVNYHDRIYVIGGSIKGERIGLDSVLEYNINDGTMKDAPHLNRGRFSA